jgi:hypothetical protein
MKNGYTPRQFAYAIAIDALRHAFENKFGELDDLTPSEKEKTKLHIFKLASALAETTKLENT